MTRSTKFLSSNTTSSSSLDQPEAQPPEAVAVESDFVVILAALLCALICVLGLFSVARCAWLRRGSTNTRGNQSQAAANKGIKKKVIETLPKFVYKKEDKGKTTGHNNDNNNNINSNININIISLADCAICLAEYTEGDEIRVLPQCGHGFHVECIDTWLNSHSSCPSCRQVLVMSRCRKCGEFPAVFAGESSTSVERKGEQGQRQRQQQGHDDDDDNNNNNNGSCSSDYLP